MGTAQRKALSIAVFVVAAASAVSTAPQQSQPMAGFTPSRAAAQRSVEARFDAQLSAGNLRAWMKQMTSRPHHLGSPHGRANAEFMAAQFRSWGYETRIDEYQVLFPVPVTRSVELVGPSRYVASLSEPPVAGDATSGQSAEQLPLYNAYSIDGDVTGELVYVNYGVPADYEELDRRGISVKGRIALARYGGSWRGIKPKVAAEHGAIGCIIFSDPHEEGYFAGDVYPKGGFRSERSAQRGSVADMPVYPGDPLTPGAGATADAKRPADFRSAQTLTRIPVLPISYSDALPLMKAIDGPTAPETWRGSLPVTYRLGPGPAKVHLKLQFDWKLRPVYDVVAVLRGSELPDQWIIRGNHHDAWVYGATDPVSGMVAEMEEARAIGELVKTGWRPRRTIVFAAWDGEEPGLLGSTEWVEAHAAELDQKAVAYVNSDSNGPGFLDAGGSHALERLTNEVAQEVGDPKKGVTVSARKLALAELRGSAAEQAAARERRAFELGPLGSGSDYTPFLQHLGVSALNIGFGGEGEYGQYHSIYDSYDHFVRFMDTDFAYGVALAKVAGRVVMRLANADVLPFEFDRLSAAISRYVGEVERLSETMRSQSRERSRLLDQRIYELVTAPGEKLAPPPRLDPVPEIDFAPLRSAAKKVEAAARNCDAAVASAVAQDSARTAEVLKKADAVIMRAERAMLRPTGLPGRPWFRHQVYAPGLYTGYGVKTLPAVREALEQRQWNSVDTHVKEVAATLESLAAELERAAGILR